jgi:hypothetical protein
LEQLGGRGRGERRNDDDDDEERVIFGLLYQRRGEGTALLFNS